MGWIVSTNEKPNPKQHSSSWRFNLLGFRHVLQSPNSFQFSHFFFRFFLRFPSSSLYLYSLTNWICALLSLFRFGSVRISKPTLLEPQNCVRWSFALSFFRRLFLSRNSPRILRDLGRSLASQCYWFSLQ